MKNERQTQLLQIISEESIETQEQLLAELQESGFNTTQATISRDIKQLHLVKEPTGHGTYKYAVSSSRARLNIADKLRTIFRESVLSVDCAQNLVVLKTIEGTLCDPFAGIKRTIEVRLTALAVVESVIPWRKLKQTGFVVQIKTVDFTVLHQKMMIIVLEASVAVLLCQLKIGKSDVQIGGGHMHFSDCGGLVSVLAQELWKSRIAGGKCAMVVPCSMLVHIQTAE